MRNLRINLGNQLFLIVWLLTYIKLWVSLDVLGSTSCQTILTLTLILKMQLGGLAFLICGDVHCCGRYSTLLSQHHSVMGKICWIDHGMPQGTQWTGSILTCLRSLKFKSLRICLKFHLLMWFSRMNLQDLQSLFGVVIFARCLNHREFNVICM